MAFERTEREEIVRDLGSAIDHLKSAEECEKKIEGLNKSIANEKSNLRDTTSKKFSPLDAQERIHNAKKINYGPKLREYDALHMPKVKEYSRSCERISKFAHLFKILRRTAFGFGVFFSSGIPLCLFAGLSNDKDTVDLTLSIISKYNLQDFIDKHNISFVECTAILYAAIAAIPLSIWLLLLAYEIPVAIAKRNKSRVDKINARNHQNYYKTHAVTRDRLLAEDRADAVKAAQKMNDAEKAKAERAISNINSANEAIYNSVERYNVQITKLNNDISVYRSKAKQILDKRDIPSSYRSVSDLSSIRSYISNQLVDSMKEAYVRLQNQKNETSAMIFDMNMRNMQRQWEMEDAKRERDRIEIEEMRRRRDEMYLRQEREERLSRQLQDIKNALDEK